MEQNYMKYTYRVRWSNEDGEYLASVAEFPSLSWLDDDQLQALQGITSLVKDIIEDMEKNGERIPVPFSIRSYSGNIRLRIPPEQHRDLAMRAAEENVSLNRLICSLISTPAGIHATPTDSQQPIEEEGYSASLTEGVSRQVPGPRLAYTRDNVASKASETECFNYRHAYDDWPKEM